MTRRWKLLVTVVVVGLVAAAIAIARAGTKGWSATAGPPAEADQVLAWLTDDPVVTSASGARTVVALAKSDGSLRWTYQVPTICAASSDLVNGAVALAYRTSDAAGTDCRGLLLLDLRSGRPRWNVTLPDRERLAAVEIAGGQVAAVRENRDQPSVDVVVAYDARSGRQRWVHESECHGTEIQPAGGRFVGDRLRIAFVGRSGEYNGEARMLDPSDRPRNLPPPGQQRDRHEPLGPGGGIVDRARVHRRYRVQHR